MCVRKGLYGSSLQPLWSLCGYGPVIWKIDSQDVRSDMCLVAVLNLSTVHFHSYQSSHR